MIKALIVGFVFLGSFTAHAQVPALQKVIALASTQGKTSTEAVTRSLLTQVEGSSSALAQVVKNDPLYIFNKGNLNEESLRYLGNEAQSALLQIGKKTTFKAVSALPEFEIALSSVGSLEHRSFAMPVKISSAPEPSVQANCMDRSQKCGFTSKSGWAVRVMLSGVRLKRTRLATQG